MTLSELLDRALTLGSVPMSRHGPLRTAVRQYAQILGVDPGQCPPERYRLPEPQLRALIDAKVPASLGPHAVRNLKNNVRYLLRLGCAQGWLESLPEPLYDWQQRRRLLDRPGGRFPRGEGEHRSRYGLYPLPPVLAQDVDAYLGWCQSPYAPGRPRRVKKRPISAEHTRETVARLAGFAVAHGHLASDTLTLAALCEPRVVDAYITWLINVQRKRVTGSIQPTLGKLRAIARHWLKDEPKAQGLDRIMAALPPAEVVRSKQARWLSLVELHRVAKSIYPLNALRLRQDGHLRMLAREVARRDVSDRRGLRPRTAWKVQVSLLLQLMLEFPWRQRQYREMRLGKHLQRRRDGLWEMRFRGAELKIEYRDGKENELSGVVPAHLQPLLEEWLQVWRPRLAPPEEDHVFVTQAGRPLPRHGLTVAVKSATWRLTGVAVTPHLIRDIWATEYLTAHPGDAATVARRLGNTIQVVYRHYAHLLNGDADARASAWLRQRFAPDDA